jgi:hypothetical protein
VRIERRRVITVELTREEAIGLRRVLDHALGGPATLDDEAKSTGSELYTGLGQNLYETRENYA